MHARNKVCQESKVCQFCCLVENTNSYLLPIYASCKPFLIILHYDSLVFLHFTIINFAIELTTAIIVSKIVGAPVAAVCV